MWRIFLLLAAVFALVGVASAQTIEIRTNQPPSSAVNAEQVRISVGVNVFMAAPGDDSEQGQKAQEAGRKIVYELAGHECAVLREVLASECRLESININVQRPNQFGNQQRPDGFTIVGNIGFRIAPK